MNWFWLKRKRHGYCGPLSFLIRHSTSNLQLLCVCVCLCLDVKYKPPVFHHGSVIKEYLSAFRCPFFSCGTTTEMFKPRKEPGPGGYINSETADWTMDVRIHLKHYLFFVCFISCFNLTWKSATAAPSHWLCLYALSRYLIESFTQLNL